MPFPIVLGIPPDTTPEILKKLRADIIRELAHAMSISPDTIRPFFLTDTLGRPSEGEDTTIYCRIDTGEYFKKDDARAAKEQVTSVVANLISATFGSKYDVEVFIGDLDPESKTYLKDRF